MEKLYPTSSYLTAISRTRPSAPAKYLYDVGLLCGKCLDYGCGRGKDAQIYGMVGYDPYWRPIQLTGTFDTITCTYVLNVLDPEDIPKVLKDIKTLLAPGGTAYLTVRRDLKGQTKKGRGTMQKNVVLPLPVVRETGGYCIYSLRGP